MLEQLNHLRGMTWEWEMLMHGSSDLSISVFPLLHRDDIVVEKGKTLIGRRGCDNDIEHTIPRPLTETSLLLKNFNITRVHAKTITQIPIFWTVKLQLSMPYYDVKFPSNWPHYIFLACFTICFFHKHNVHINQDPLILSTHKKTLFLATISLFFYAKA